VTGIFEKLPLFTLKQEFTIQASYLYPHPARDNTPQGQFLMRAMCNGRRAGISTEGSADTHPSF
jgi:hypothetical protein